MGLVKDLLRHGFVKTTFAKAKAVQPMMEHLITQAKGATSGTRQKIERVLPDAKSIKQLMLLAKTRFVSRTSGYTRIIKLGRRKGDAVETVLFSFVDAAPIPVPQNQEDKQSNSAGAKESKKPKKSVSSRSKEKTGKKK